MRNLPEKHQTLLFSATMPIEIETLSQMKVQMFFMYTFCFIFYVHSQCKYASGNWATWSGQVPLLALSPSA